eukprot:4066360-Prymnesium_polylepis.1
MHEAVGGGLFGSLKIRFSRVCHAADGRRGTRTGADGWSYRHACCGWMGAWRPGVSFNVHAPFTRTVLTPSSPRYKRAHGAYATRAHA